MTAPAHLLPPNRGRAEEALATGVAAQFPLPVPVGDLWNPDAIPAHLLAWLAWALSVDDWDREWPEATKRRVIAESVEIHRRKGTLASVKRTLRAQGWVLDTPYFEQLYAPKSGDPEDAPRRDGMLRRDQRYFNLGAEIVEQYGRERRNGTVLRNGTGTYDAPDHWAEYRVRLLRALTIEQAAVLRRALANVAPARAHLTLNFTAIAHRRNNAIQRDGTYSRGAA